MRSGEKFSKFVVDSGSKLYEKYAPYSFKVVRKKIKEMGLEFTPKQYLIQFVIIVGATALVTYLYFYNEQ